MIKCYNVNYIDIIKKYCDNEKAIIYLDPPYMVQGHQLYNHSLEFEEYEQMVDLLKKSKGAKYVISHDDNKDFVDLFDGWANVRTIENVPYTINSIKGNRKKELLFTN